jgi:hypothetical protein
MQNKKKTFHEFTPTVAVCIDSAHHNRMLRSSTGVIACWILASDYTPSITSATHSALDRSIHNERTATSSSSGRFTAKSVIGQQYKRNRIICSTHNGI